MNHWHEKFPGTVAEEPLGFSNFLALTFVHCATAGGPLRFLVWISLLVKLWIIQEGPSQVSA